MSDVGGYWVGVIGSNCLHYVVLQRMCCYTDLGCREVPLSLIVSPGSGKRRCKKCESAFRSDKKHGVGRYR